MIEQNIFFYCIVASWRNSKQNTKPNAKKNWKKNHEKNSESMTFSLQKKRIKTQDEATSSWACPSL